MSQIFVKDFDAQDKVHDTMESVFDNTKTLKSSFSGDNEPGDPEVGMLWANTLGETFNIRGTSGWWPIMDLDTGEVSISIGQIEGDDISNSARKGSIVEGEAISPSSCTFKAKETPPAALPNIRSYGVNYTLLAQPQVFETKEVYRIYIDPDVTFLEMHAMFTGGVGRFGLSTSYSPSVLDYTSSDTSTVTGTGWTTSTAVLPVTSLADWYYLKVQGKSASGSVPGVLLGFSFRFGI